MDREIEKLLQSKEYDFLRTDPHLGDNICLLTFGGSRAYGTNLPTSDIDIRGIAIPTKKEIILAKDFENIVDTKTDTTIYSVEKIIKLLSECNPNTLEILGLPEEDYFVLKGAGKLLYEKKNIFLSKKCAKSFMGYAMSQLYRLRQKSKDGLSPLEYNEHITKVLRNMEERLYKNAGVHLDFDFDENGIYFSGNFNRVNMECIPAILGETNNTYRDYKKSSKRNNNAEVHNKIPKHSMHLVRLLLMGKELLLTGEIHTKRVKEHDLLMDIRNGKYVDENNMPIKEFFEMVDDITADFEKAEKMSILPEVADMDAIDNLRYEIYESIIEGNKKH